MAALIDAIEVKRKAFFEFEDTPFLCLEAVVNTPTARGGQTLVRLKMRNLLTNAVFEKSFKASDKFKEPDLQSVPASYLYSDGDGSHFLDRAHFTQATSTAATQHQVTGIVQGTVGIVPTATGAGKTLAAGSIVNGPIGAWVQFAWTTVLGGGTVTGMIVGTACN